MNIKDIQTLYAYNTWAKDRLLGVLAPLTVEQFVRDFSVSHGSIRSTLSHMMGAEEIWLQRWNNQPVTGFRKPEDFPDLPALAACWQTITAGLDDFCRSLKSYDDLYASLAYTDLEGKPYTQPLYQSMQHVVNHSTHHRGQVVAMLRQLGIVPVDTDLITYYRERVTS